MFGDNVLATIERPWLGNKTFVSCIPEGTYLCEKYSSARYPDTYEIINVVGRTKILFHVGNWAKDVQGCIAIGKSISDTGYMVVSSKLAVGEFIRYHDGADEFKINIRQYKPE